MMIYGSMGVRAGLAIGAFLKVTPSISCSPGLEFDSIVERRLARFVYELLFTMFSFSACMPRILGGVENAGGGVGGTLEAIVSKTSR
jgi:hypothetical protein